MIGRLCERIANGEGRDQLMNSEWLRFESFKEFPPSIPISALKLSKEGLFYVGNGQNDWVKCFSCNIILSGLSKFDVPAEIHKIRSPNCDFVKGTDCDNIPIHGHDSLPPSHALSRHGQGGEVEETAGASGGVPQDKGMGQYTLANPKFPKFRCHADRFNSFVNKWIKEEVVKSEKLAYSGFFYSGVGDLVRCFQCGIGLRNWCAGDDPWVEHSKIYKWCKYLEDEKGKVFIQEHAEQELVEDLDNQDNTGADGPEGVDGSGLGKQKTVVNRRQSKGNVNGCKESGEGIGKNDFEEKYDALKSENKVLFKRLVCKICLNNEVNVVFLPCGHLVSCQACAPHISKCAICRTSIEGKSKIFLA